MNAAKQFSLKHGKPVKVGSTTYMGANPVFFNLETNPAMPARFIKVSKGVPYVKVDG
jgi:hypothetical protein